MRRCGDIGELSTLIAPFSKVTPVDAHTDAQGLGHIAAVFAPTTSVVDALQLPVRLCRMTGEDDG